MMRLLILVLVIAGLTGCGSRGTSQPDPSIDTRPAQPNIDQSVQQPVGVGVGDPSTIGSTPINSNFAAIPSERVVYFDFDRSELRPQDQALLQAHASYLSMNPNVIIRLEGHADERGSREYNLALGERRAQAVKRALSILGVQPNQSTTLSYGEEKPLAFGSDESSWQLNRRVELVYPTGF